MNANANSIVQHVIQIKSGTIITHTNVNVKIVAHAKNIVVGILLVCENDKYLNIITAASVVWLY